MPRTAAVLVAAAFAGASDYEASRSDPRRRGFGLGCGFVAPAVVTFGVLVFNGRQATVFELSRPSRPGSRPAWPRLAINSFVPPDDPLSAFTRGFGKEALGRLLLSSTSRGVDMFESHDAPVLGKPNRWRERHPGRLFGVSERDGSGSTQGGRGVYTGDPAKTILGDGYPRSPRGEAGIWISAGHCVGTGIA